MALLGASKLKRLLTLGRRSSRAERLRKPSSLCAEGSRYSSSSASFGSGCDAAAKPVPGPASYAGHVDVSERWGEAEGDVLRVQFALVRLDRPAAAAPGTNASEANERLRQSFGDSFLLTVCSTGRGVGAVALDPEQRESLLETGAGKPEVVGVCLQRLSDVPKDVREGVDSVFHALQRFPLPARFQGMPLELGSARVFLLDATSMPHDEVALGKLEACQLLVQHFRCVRSRAAVARAREMENVRLVALLVSQQRRH